jgi:threonine aldolase
MGIMNPADIETAIRPKGLHSARTTLVCIENTHNRAGGTIATPSQIEAISKVTKRHGLRLYMDGARIFNAAVALKADVQQFTRHVDNMMFCLSKGLSCPVGSLVVGTEEHVQRARRNRKILGGGMRQAGVIAAAGIVALETMIDRLEDDHRNARLLAEGLLKIDGVKVDVKTVQTNMVMFDVDGLGVRADAFVKKLKEHGVLSGNMSRTRVRMVTHRGIEQEDIEKALTLIDETVKELRLKKP